MLYEFHGICQHCAEENKVIFLNGELLSECSKCSQSPFVVKRFRGIIYVIHNPNQAGVKIGLTTKSMEQRLKSLNSTGVPGNFQTIAIFPSDNPAADEKRVHDKLRRKNLAKEHFDIEPVDAVLAAYRALNKRQPIFFDDSIRDTFHLKLEKARIEMQLRLKGVAE